MGDNAALTAAKRAKKDEFYTQRVDIDISRARSSSATATIRGRVSSSSTLSRTSRSWG